MGQQQTSLDCKENQFDKKAQTSATQQFARKDIKNGFSLPSLQQSQRTLGSQNVITAKSSKNSSTKPGSARTIFAKSPRLQQRPKLFIPSHQCITKVSEFPFNQSKKEKKFYVEQKSKTLGEIIEPRYNSTKHFPYSQILGLTESLIYSLAYFSKKKCNHHDFYPTNIYYVEGKFKIINPLELQCSGFYLTTERSRFSFLAPELIIAILEERVQAQLGQEIMDKSDVFAIGMILLEVCSLQPSSECYDEQTYNIVDLAIKERLAKVATIYTPLMAQCINLMLEYQIQHRINPLILSQIIHSRMQNEKKIAFQMQQPKNRPPQVQGQQPIRGPPPNFNPQNMMQQQMIQRGPPPPPLPPQPYSHHSFKMQNLNPNLIAVTVPNERFKINQNNQGFLSSSSLQQKLKVIQLIKQNPNQEDSQGQEKQQKTIIHQNQIVHQIPKQQNTLIQTYEDGIQNRIRPQYSMVQSIYNQQPNPRQIPQNQRIQPQQIYNQHPIFSNQVPPHQIQLNPYQRITTPSQEVPSITTHRPIQRKQQELRMKTQPINNQDHYQYRSINNKQNDRSLSPRNEKRSLSKKQPIKPQNLNHGVYSKIQNPPNIPKQYSNVQQNIPQNFIEHQIDNPIGSNAQIPNYPTNIQAQQSRQPYLPRNQYGYNVSQPLTNQIPVNEQQQPRQVLSNFNYRTNSLNQIPPAQSQYGYTQPSQSINIKNNFNNQYIKSNYVTSTNVTNTNNQQLTSKPANKYGTSEEIQSLQERVQRVLQMSKNIH